ncbi:Single-stranded DNA-binding protein [bacterium HR25]|nr:Single-stranded DNA-binding protein [bacterium HR25]
MAGLNKIMVIGNVGTDPEMRFTANGDAMTTFRVATNYVYTTPDGDRREETEWFSVITWRRLAEQCNLYLQKGRRVYVEGRLRSRSWDGADGQRRFVNEILAERVVFLDRPGAAPLLEGAEPSAEEGLETDSSYDAP